MKATVITLLCLFFCLLSRDNFAHAETFQHKIRFLPHRNFERKNGVARTGQQSSGQLVSITDDDQNIASDEDEDDEFSRRSLSHSKAALLYSYACLLASSQLRQSTPIPFDFHLASLSCSKYLRQRSLRI